PRLPLLPFLSPLLRLPPPSTPFPYRRSSDLADWIVVPDIVMGGMASLKFSRSWLARLRDRRVLSNARFMVAVQNGIVPAHVRDLDRKSTRLNSSHVKISYAVFCLKKKKTRQL